MVDGGAIDNRGLISLLYYIHGLPPQVQQRVHVLMLDVSALGTGFSQTRGTKAAFGAAGKLATQLISELTEDLAGVTFYDLTLPRLFRAGFGTHWRMQQTVTLKATPTDTVDLAKRKTDKVKLSAAEIEEVFEQMFVGPPEGLSDESLRRVWDWTLEEYEDPDRPTPWEEFERLLTALGE